MNQHDTDDVVTIERMRHLPLFASLSGGDLDTLYHMTRTVTVAADQVLMEEGGPPDAAYVIVDGEMEVTTRRGDEDLLIAVRRDGDLVGEMSLLEQAPRSATVRARRPTCLIEITQSALETLLSCSRAARWAILAGVASRLRSTQSLLEQNARLAQLGELAADLAHEINNPAAAVRRSVGQLRTALDTRDELTTRIAGQPLITSSLERVRQSAVEHAAQPTVLDTLAHADREDELLAWLEEHGVDRAWEAAEVLASYGWTTPELTRLIEPFGDADAGPLVQLAATWTQVHGLLGEIGRSAKAISERVQAVKEYAFLDQAPVQRVDVHDGLENTLVMLRTKFSPGVAIKREYARDLPIVEAYGRELNQVWENLITNALDAMGERGELVLRTWHEPGWVHVEVVDTGAGIPSDVLPRLFEAGFTTKAPGQGTGRGLHIARNIVEDKHRGKIDVTTTPGRTQFRVTLPIELPKR
ncbi:MAG TPA: ATP-binding protein [Chloroflexota bacterium]